MPANGLTFIVVSESPYVDQKSGFIRIKVTGTWDGANCELSSMVTGMMCPGALTVNGQRSYNFDKATCDTCTKGFALVSVDNDLTTHNLKCTSWFFRADSSVRAAYSMLRTSSEVLRVDSCAKLMMG